MSSVLTLNKDKLAEAAIPITTGWMLGVCMEARGKQDLWMRQKPEVLAVLREQAIIKSVESSNRIEGVTIPSERLRPVVLGKAKPRDRSEEELAGYRKALDWIFSRKRPVAIRPDVVRKLHAMAQGGLMDLRGDAGQWKTKNNEIVEILPNGERSIRFVPTSAKDTPKTMEHLCLNFREAVDEKRIPTLLLIATFVFDFLCVHPFRDGNGRVSRLATTLLLKEHGFDVGRYISLERLVEEEKVEYYRVLAECSKGWSKGENEILPWWNHFLGILRHAYQDFERQMELTGDRPPKTDLVRQTVLNQVETFTLADLAAQLPAVSRQLIKKVLSQMKDEGMVQLSGKGRGARWDMVR